MKASLYTLALLLCATLASAQTVPSSCTAPDNIVKQYADDADYITLQRIIALGNTYADSIEIPQQWADTALRAMIAVYNATTLPARDSVVTKYKIHEYATPTMHMIFLTADTSQLYMKQMFKNIFPTGDPDFDNLGNTYTMKNWQYLFGIANFHDLNLYLDSAYNTPVLKDEYNMLPGLQMAKGTLNLYGDSSHISYQPTASYVKLDYTYGWSNCMDANGCDKKHTWTFHVSYNCDVTYIGSSGDPLFPVNSVKDIAAAGISIYPNPATSLLNISGFEGNYTIHNIYGSKLQEGKTTNTINIQNLPAGQYLLQLQNETASYISRFVKQ